MAGFIGKEQHAIDAKGRLMIPARFRKRFESLQAGTKNEASPDSVFLYVMKAVDGSLELYEPEVWAEKEKSLSGLSDFNPDERMLKTLMYESLDSVEMDRHGRIALPKDFMQHAGITKDVVVIGANVKMILWSPEKLSSVLRKNSSRFQVLAARYF
ncbi:MAG: division/cell wall cluster transcriptional repressor MraZ [Chlorobiales bacterium]|nr:division/cell wall cluster transcriptional repressor MraZ [Chlorobiales bacterium]